MKGRCIPYSPAEMKWLEANHLLVISDYAEKFRAKFKRDDVTAVHLHALRKRKGWKTGRTGCFERGIVPHNQGKRCPEGVGGKHPNARKTQFRKGRLPHNTNFAGHERVSIDGYVEISVNERNPHTGYERRYVLKHRWLWEKENGPVPDGMALKCLDGDRTNVDPSNWDPVPRALLPRLNGGRRKQHIAYDTAPAELKPTLMAVAKLEHRLHEKQQS